MTTTTETPVEQRLLAAIAHASILAQGIGLLVGLYTYISHREKSTYVAFQGLQAAVFQAFSLLIVIASWVIWTGFYLLTFIPLLNNPGDEPGFWFWAGMGSMLIPLGIMLILGLMGLIGAVRVWRGADFRYPIIGPWLEKAGLFNG